MVLIKWAFHFLVAYVALSLVNLIHSFISLIVLLRDEEYIIHRRCCNAHVGEPCVRVFLFPHKTFAFKKKFIDRWDTASGRIQVWLLVIFATSMTEFHFKSWKIKKHQIELSKPQVFNFEEASYNLVLSTVKICKFKIYVRI